MHIPDGFLSAAVAAGTWTVAAAGIGTALRSERRDPVRVPAGILGSLAAFVFAAQMVNIPVAPGTSGHLVGATLVAMIVGPWRATLVLAAVLVIQAILFQDGGLTAFGANLIDLGFAGAFVGYAVAVLTMRAVGGPRGLAAGAMLGAFAATLASATLTALWLGLSGLYPLSGILSVLLASHSAIGVLEAALTGAILVTVMRWRPDLVIGTGTAGAPRRPGAMAAGLFGLALVIAAFIAPFASSLPDGLQRASAELGLAPRAAPILTAPPAADALFRDWLGPVATIAAGLLGTVIAAALAWTVSRGLARGTHASHR